jgi:monothiol glutaredoxin
MTSRPQLPEERRTPAVADAIASFHSDVVRQVRDAVDQGGIVVVGTAQNPFVKKVRQALKEADLPFTYLEYGSYLGEWKKRLAIKMWSGWPTFPQVFVKGVLIGGNEETRAAIADGSLKARLDDKQSN